MDLLERLQRLSRRLRWRLTWSYMLVTVSALLSLVVAGGSLALFWTLVPARFFTPEVFVGSAQRNAVPLVSQILESAPELLPLWLDEIANTVSEYPALRLGQIELWLRTTAQIEIYVLDTEGNLLGVSPTNLVPAEAIGAPLDLEQVANLAGPLKAALYGATASEYLTGTIQPNSHFVVAAPLFGQDGTVLGALGAEIKAMPTRRDTFRLTLRLVGASLAAFLAAAGLMAAVFGALTSRALTRRFEHLEHVSRAWSAGDFSARIDDPTGDEISHLAERLNAMAAQLHELLAARQARAAEQERGRLARDLHDSAKQQALAAAFQLGTALSLLDHDPEGARSHLKEAERLVDAVRLELTGLITELRPPALEGRDFGARLERYTRTWAEQGGFELELQITAAPGLPAEAQASLFRVLQEALANIARHSGAHRVAVRLQPGNGSLELQVEDDGCGFDAAAPRAGFGLDSMRARAAALGGRFTAHSSPGQGTRLRLSLPNHPVKKEM